MQKSTTLRNASPMLRLGRHESPVTEFQTFPLLILNRAELERNFIPQIFELMNYVDMFN